MSLSQQAASQEHTSPQQDTATANARLSDHGNAARVSAMEDDHDHNHDHGEGIEQEPASGEAVQDLDTTRPTGDPIPSDLRERLMTQLKAAPASLAVLDAIEAARGDLDFDIRWSDKGNYHSRGKISLDRNRDEAKWLSSMMHELVHLQTYLEGNAANATTMTREAFVEAKMSDEINAQATAYVALIQSGITSDQSAGYNDFRAHLTADHADALEGEQWSAIKTAALAWLENKYKNEWTTSNSNQNYYEYWGASWDKKNPGK